MRGSRGVYRVALTAVLAAVSLILLYLSTLLPTGRMGIVALAGLTPAAAVVSSGVGAGVLCYAGTGILALILLPDKGGALLYLLFFGLYPIVKYAVERLRRLPLELFLKLVFFNGVLTVFWFGLRASCSQRCRRRGRPSGWSTRAEIWCFCSMILGFHRSSPSTAGGSTGSCGRDAHNIRWKKEKGGTAYGQKYDRLWQRRGGPA